MRQASSATNIPHTPQAWRHRAFSPCASFLFKEGWASGCKRTPCRQGFRHRVHNNTNTLCLLFPTRAACLSINALEFWRGKSTKSIPDGCTMPYSRGTMRYQKRLFNIKSRLARYYKNISLLYRTQNNASRNILFCYLNMICGTQGFSKFAIMKYSQVSACKKKHNASIFRQGVWHGKVTQ